MAGPAVRFDAPGLSQLAKDLRAVDRSLVRELRTAIRAAARPVEQQAKANAATFSRRIPGAITTSVTFPARGAKVTLRVNAKKAPHGRALEHEGTPGRFRHPVFGSRTWVDQPAHPYFFRAVAAQRRLIELRVETLSKDLARRAGFH